MIPTTDPGEIIRESQPFIDYLQMKTGAKVELTVPTNYAAVVEAVSNDRVDIAYFGASPSYKLPHAPGLCPWFNASVTRIFTACLSPSRKALFVR